jgi:hypothetical protein
MSKNSTNSQSTNAATVESIKSIAESIGLSNLSEEACREVVSDLTFTIKSILQVQLFNKKKKPFNFIIIKLFQTKRMLKSLQEIVKERNYLFQTLNIP